MIHIAIIYVFGCWLYTLCTLLIDGPMLFGRALSGSLSGVPIERARLCFVFGALIATFLSPLYIGVGFCRFLCSVLLRILPRGDDVR